MCIVVCWTQGLARGTHPCLPARHHLAQSVRNVSMASSSATPSEVLPVDHSSSPFHELDLEELWKGIGRTRVRQHVNPLRSEYLVPTGPVEWAKAFKDPTLPLIIDLGCGPGRFLLLLFKRHMDRQSSEAVTQRDGQAVQQQQYNYLGIEIRKPLVERANEWATRLGYADHVHYVYSNATFNLATMISDYPGKVDSVYIQFPDPHFKKRHRKRRIFQPELVRAVRDLLPSGGQLFLQSDVEMVASAMRNAFEMYAYEEFALSPHHTGREEDIFFSCQQQAGSGSQAAAAEAGEEAASQGAGSRREAESYGAAESSEDGEDAQHSGHGNDTDASLETSDDYDSLQSKWQAAGWLRTNPIGVPTEREHACGQKGLPVYRVLLVRN